MFKFDQREIPTYPQPIPSDQLIEGETYFHVLYVDRDMKIPMISSLVYIGKNFGDDEVSTLYFQDPRSYRAGVRITDENLDPDSVQLESFPEASFHGVFDFDHALEELMKCSLRRKE